MTPVFLDERARLVVEREGVSKRLRETGGCLFGWQNQDDVFVACASGPGPGARHRPRRFAPAPAVVATLMHRVLTSSESRYGYLGSWHTHPFAEPRPSATDSGTARAMAGQDDLHLPRPLLLILSTTGTKTRVRPGELAAWTWNAETKELEEASLEDVRLGERYCPTAAMLFAA